MLLGDGLLTSEGDHHRRQRRLVQPAFHRDRLAGYGAVMVERSAVVRDQWQSGQPFDVLQEMMRLTLAIVAKTLFSTDVDSEADDIGAALTQVFDLFEIILMPFSEILEKLPLPAVRRFHRARKRLDETIYRLIAERRAEGRDAGDLLSMLLLARDEDGRGGMTDEQVRDEALTLFLAGHETTADALTWAWYLLSQNPQAEAAFHAELDRVLAGRLPSFDDLPQLRYTESVFAEALRLYPPAWGIGRRALEDYPVGDFVIPARSVVLMSPYVVHRDPRWFPDPLVFRPERWLVEDPARPKFAYFPFGGGARVCIGALRVDGRDAASSRHRAALAPAAGTRTPCGDTRADYAAPEARDADDRREASTFFGVHHRDVAQVAIPLLEVQAAAHHEPVGDLKTSIVHRHLNNSTCGAVEERADSQRARLASGQRLQQVARGEAGIHDIFHQQNIFVLNGMIQVLGDSHHAWSTVAKARNRQEIDLERNLDGARQSGQKEYRAFQHRDQFQVTTLILRADFRRHFLDALVHLLFGEQDPFDARRSRQRTASFKPCLNTRSWKSFW